MSTPEPRRSDVAHRHTGVVGARSIWPYAHWRLRSGSILWVARGIKMGVINIDLDGVVPVTFIGPDGSQDATLHLGEPVTYESVTVTMIEAALAEHPRWIRIVAKQTAAPAKDIPAP